MRLTAADLENAAPWTDAGFVLPRFDRRRASDLALLEPEWIHFGTGNISGAFLAAMAQDLLEKGAMASGLIMVSGIDLEIIDRIYRPHDNLILLVTLKADGGIAKRVLASVAHALKADSDDPDFFALRELFRKPSLRMASFTITEKGYNLAGRDGDFLPAVRDDFARGTASPKSYLGMVTALLHQRFLAGGLPIAMVSMDNCSRNGSRLFDAIKSYADHWAAGGLVDKGFVDYVRDPRKVSFPWTMIDKITPRPDPTVKKMLEDSGFADAGIVVTAMNSYVAPFVNAEESEYLVIEDAFPAGRPPLDKAGVLFADRETVEKVEKMKVGTCLNPLHTSLAVFGCLLGFTRISDEMRDPDLKKLVEIVGYREGLPAVVDPGIINPRDFIREVLEVRIPNPFMPDTPQRIATDTSQKLAPRFGETIKTYMKQPDLDVADLRLIPLVLAAWCRYLLGVDDAGRDFEVSPDPRYGELSAALAGLKPGAAGPYGEKLRPLLADTTLFGVNLYDAGLGDTVEALFADLMTGPGAVRATLHRMVEEQ